MKVIKKSTSYYQKTKTTVVHPFVLITNNKKVMDAYDNLINPKPKTFLANF